MSTLRRYIVALGATTTIVVTFADHTTMTLPLEQLARSLNEPARAAIRSPS